MDLQIILAYRQILLNLPVELAEVGQAGSAHPDNEVLICNVLPLLFLLVSFEILVLVFYIGLPGYAFLIDWIHSSILFANWGFELIREEALGHETTREGRLLELFIGKWCSINEISLLAFFEVRVFRDRIAFFDFGGADVVPIAHELLVRARFNITPMVLIKVVELIVHIDWRRNLLFDFDCNGALFPDFLANIAVLFGEDLDILAHYVEQNAKR